MKKEFSSISLRIPHQAQIRLPINSKRVYVLLHGYQLDGEYIYNKLEDIIPHQGAIISPNGPFMVPYKRKEEYFARYAWYFFDPNKKSYYINFEPAAEYIKSILIEMNLVKKPITIIGYSQGGYLAPKVAEMIPSVDTVIGMACTFRNERFKFKSDCLYHQINSEDDLIVDYSGSKEEFETLRERGNVGRFITLKDEGHKLSSSYLQELKMLL